MDQRDTEPGQHRMATVVVCGLGSLGLACTAVLRRYGVPVQAVDIDLETATLVAERRSRGGVDSIHGDCRHVEVLRRAGIEQARAILLVTGDSRTNVEAALAARRLNQTIRIVARTAQDNISQLLTERLSNFVAYEPSRLAAGALALAASSNEVIGHFHVDGRLVRVLRRPVEDGGRWQGAAIKELGPPRRRRARSRERRRGRTAKSRGRSSRRAAVLRPRSGSQHRGGRRPDAAVRRARRDHAEVTRAAAAHGDWRSCFAAGGDRCAGRRAWC